MGIGTPLGHRRCVLPPAYVLLVEVSSSSSGGKEPAVRGDRLQSRNTSAADSRHDHRKCGCDHGGPAERRSAGPRRRPGRRRRGPARAAPPPPGPPPPPPGSPPPG